MTRFRDGRLSSGMQDFRKLLVWQRAHALGLQVDGVIARFPRRGHASRKAQLSDASDSIATNIVEGCGAATQKEFARFLDMSIKSTSETEYHLLGARDRGLVRDAIYTKLTSEVVEIRRMLYGLRKKVLGHPD